jgi:hypothetical protein
MPWQAVRRTWRVGVSHGRAGAARVWIDGPGAVPGRGSTQAHWQAGRSLSAQRNAEAYGVGYSTAAT